MVETFNHEIIEIPHRRFPYELNDQEEDWLYEVFKEETQEFDEAWHQNDLIGQVDALMDLIYFAMGGLTRLGVSADKSLDIFKTIHAKNMAKHKGNKGRGSDLDAVKPDSWEGPEDSIKKILGEY